MRLRLATFNIENLGERSGGDIPTAARRPTLLAQLGRLKADILCLQEVNAQIDPAGRGRRLIALESLLADTPYAAFHRVSTLNRQQEAPLDIHNLVILSRWPVRCSRQTWNDIVAPPCYRPLSADDAEAETAAIGWDRPVLHAEIDVGLRRPLHVINLHLRAPIAAHIPEQKLTPTVWKSVAAWAEGFFVAAAKQAGQAFEVRLMVEAIFEAEAEALIAVAGDFNATGNEMPPRIIRGDPADTGNVALAPRALVALADEGGGAYTVLHGHRRIMLDHILASRSLAVRCRKIVIDNAALLDETEPAWLSTRRPGSYHAPMVAEFELA